jgi:hypothetical protein
VDVLHETLKKVLGNTDADAFVEMRAMLADPLTMLRPASRKVTRSESIIEYEVVLMKIVDVSMKESMGPGSTVTETLNTLENVTTNTPLIMVPMS